MKNIGEAPLNAYADKRWGRRGRFGSGPCDEGSATEQPNDATRGCNGLHPPVGISILPRHACCRIRMGLLVVAAASYLFLSRCSISVVLVVLGIRVLLLVVVSTMSVGLLVVLSLRILLLIVLLIISSVCIAGLTLVFSLRVLVSSMGVVPVSLSVVGGLHLRLSAISTMGSIVIRRSSRLGRNGFLAVDVLGTFLKRYGGGSRNWRVVLVLGRRNGSSSNSRAKASHASTRRTGNRRGNIVSFLAHICRRWLLHTAIERPEITVVVTRSHPCLSPLGAFPFPQETQDQEAQEEDPGDGANNSANNAARGRSGCV